MRSCAPSVTTVGGSSDAVPTCRTSSARTGGAARNSDTTSAVLETERKVCDLMWACYTENSVNGSSALPEGYLGAARRHGAQAAPRSRKARSQESLEVLRHAHARVGLVSGARLLGAHRG